MAREAVKAVVAAFIVRAHGAVVARDAMFQIGNESTLLAVVAREEEIAVFVAAAHVRVIAVFVLERSQTPSGNNAHQGLELVEERQREVHRPAVGKRIPLVAPPLGEFVDLERFVRRVHGDDLLPRTIA